MQNHHPTGTVEYPVPPHWLLLRGLCAWPYDDSSRYFSTVSRLTHTAFKNLSTNPPYVLYVLSSQAAPQGSAVAIGLGGTDT